METALNEALSDVRRKLSEFYGERLGRVVLFGSRARGDAHAGSDVDLLVVLKGAFDLYRESKRLADIEISAMEQFGFFFQVLLYDEKTFNDRGHPLMVMIRAEGVEI